MLFLTLFYLHCSCFHFYSGVSSFNQFIHELAIDSDVSSMEYTSGEEDDYDDEYDYPDTPSSVSSRVSRASSTNYGRRQVDWNWIQYILLWISVSVKFLLRIPFHLFQLAYSMVSKPRGNQHSAQSHSYARVQSLKDQIIHQATDRRRGIVEVLQHLYPYIKLCGVLLQILFL